MPQTFEIRLLTTDDLSAAIELGRVAGWNQLQRDWTRLIDDEPNGCFAATIDDTLVGTVTTTCYGVDLAWIGMMLVHPEYRRRGIAPELMNASLDYLRCKKVSCIKLDATPAGQPVYQRLGFRCEWEFHRWRREPTREATRRILAVEPPLAIDAALDLRAFGVDRLKWLIRLAADSTVCRHSDGFGMLRPGSVASYLGPVSARDAESAAEMIGELLQTTAEPVFWDVPGPNEQARRLARELGFEPVRELTRMWIGDELLSPQIQLQYAICDPGTG